MKENEERGEIVLYQPEGEVRLEVRVENETVWLTQAQMARLFERDRSVIAKHIKNAFNEGELDSKVVCANFAHTKGSSLAFFHSAFCILHHDRHRQRISACKPSSTRKADFLLYPQ